MAITKKVCIEDCAILTASKAAPPQSIAMTSALCFARGTRRAFLCPGCGRRCFKLYRPMPTCRFACRACHDLTYLSAQRHDSRLATLMDGPADSILRAVTAGDGKVRILGLAAGYFRAGVFTRRQTLRLLQSL
jgi:hypothetical protein